MRRHCQQRGNPERILLHLYTSGVTRASNADQHAYIMAAKTLKLDWNTESDQIIYISNDNEKRRSSKSDANKWEGREKNASLARIS